MKIVTETYTTKLEYAEQNQTKIKHVMADLQKLNHPGINYYTLLSIDGKQFIHTKFFRSSEDKKILTDLPSFANYQKQLFASGLETLPDIEHWIFVGSSNNIFNHCCPDKSGLKEL
jgi:hypothetical protein